MTPQSGQIRRAEPPPRTGQQPCRSGAGQRIDEQPQHTHQVADLWCSQQPAQSHHLDGNIARTQRRGQRCHVRAAPHQHRGGQWVTPVHHRRVPAVGDGAGNPVHLGTDVGQQGTANLAGFGTVSAAQLADRNRPAAKLTGDGVSHREHFWGVAEAGEQSAGDGGRPVAAGKVSGEARQVGRGGAAPAID
jgi:hypothetical protein